MEGLFFMKKKNLKKNVLIISIVVILVIGSILGIVVNSRKIAKPERKQIVNTFSVENQNEEKLSSPKEVKILSEVTIELLEKILRESNLGDTEKQFDVADSTEVNERKRSGVNRSEIFTVYDESGNILNLRDTYFGTVDLSDGITFSIDSRNQLGEVTSSENKKRTRRASNRTQTDYDSIESTLSTVTELKDTVIQMTDISDISEKIMGRIYFDYGSSLDPTYMNLSIEKYLLIQKQSQELKEYSSIILGLNDLISKIPEDKKNSAVFILMGYADTTLFNAVPEISDRSARFNTSLSLKRAETIKAILMGKNFGISQNKIVSQGLGYSKNVNAISDLWKYRRVDIVISYE